MGGRKGWREGDLKLIRFSSLIHVPQSMRCRDLQHSSEANKTTLNKVPAVFWVNLLKPQDLCVGKNDCTPPQFLPCSTRWSVAGLGRVYPATTALCDCISLTQSRTTQWKLFHRYFLALEVSFCAPLHLLLSIPEQCPPLLAALWCFWVLFHFGFPQLQHKVCPYPVCILGV